MIPGSGGGLGTGGSSSVRRSDWLRVLPLVEILFSLPVFWKPRREMVAPLSDCRHKRAR